MLDREADEALASLPPPIPPPRVQVALPPPIPPPRTRAALPPPIPPPRARGGGLPPPPGEVVPDLPEPLCELFCASGPSTLEFDEAYETTPIERLRASEVCAIPTLEHDTVELTKVERAQLIADSWMAEEDEPLEVGVDVSPPRRKILVVALAAVGAAAMGVSLLAVVDNAAGVAASAQPAALSGSTPTDDERLVRVPAETAAPREPAAAVQVERSEKKRQHARPSRRPAPRSSRLGTLMLGAKPPCQIYIDGRKTGKTTPQRNLRLRPGKHRVTLRNAQYRIKKSFEVTIEAGRRVRIIKDMSSKIRR